MDFWGTRKHVWPREHSGFGRGVGVGGAMDIGAAKNAGAIINAMPNKAGQGLKAILPVP